MSNLGGTLLKFIRVNSGKICCNFPGINFKGLRFDHVQINISVGTGATRRVGGI